MKLRSTITATLLLTGSLFGDVVTVTPYGGGIDYDSSSTKTFKDSGIFYGAYASVGNLSYLAEVAYTKTQIKYKDPTAEDLKQDEFTLAYAHYWSSVMVRIGGHILNSNDAILGDGKMGFVSVGGYKYVGYNKYSYGVEGYYSKYKDGRDEKGTPKSIAITQITPYVSAYNVLSTNVGNLFSLKLNYEHAPDYVKTSYTSYEASDTIYYKKTYLTLKGYTGQMRTAMRDGGFTAISTLDLLNYGYGAQVGYYFTPSVSLALDYNVNDYREYGATQDGKYAVYNATFSMKF